jgi:hypothetical protein
LSVKYKAKLEQLRQKCKDTSLYESRGYGDKEQKQIEKYENEIEQLHEENTALTEEKNQIIWIEERKTERAVASETHLNDAKIEIETLESEERDD